MMDKMKSEKNALVFAAVGDVHGNTKKMIQLLQEREANLKTRIQFVLQVGDFEPHRNEEDLRTMAAPSKYKKLGDFPDFYAGKCTFPWPVYFIGGNHEPYGFLDNFQKGMKITENCHYIGRVGMIEIMCFKVVGLSGIYHETMYLKPRPKVEELHNTSNKAYTYFVEQDIEEALGYDKADILMVHEWPSGIIDPAHKDELEKQRHSLKYDRIGNEYARMLMDILEPKLVICGHMHKKYRTKFMLPAGSMTDICCLGHVKDGHDAVAVFRASSEGLQITEI